MDEDVPRVDAARTALVLMDFQPAVLGAVTETDTAALVANAEKALTWARSAGPTHALTATCKSTHC
jgi:nicotinamidase-related amidase